MIFIFNFAIAAFNVNAGIAKILFRYSDVQFFSQILELLIQFLRFQWRHPFCASG